MGDVPFAVWSCGMLRHIAACCGVAKTTQYAARRRAVPHGTGSSVNAAFIV